MTVGNLFINSRWTGRTSCLPNAVRSRTEYPVLAHLVKDLGQIVFQVADSTKAGPLAVSRQAPGSDPPSSLLTSVQPSDVHSCRLALFLLYWYCISFWYCIGSIPAGWQNVQSLPNLGETPSSLPCILLHIYPTNQTPTLHKNEDSNKIQNLRSLRRTY